MAENKLVSEFKAARRVGVPLIGVTSPDPQATVDLLCEGLRNGTEPPVLQWDCVRGLTGTNKPGKQAAKELFSAKGIDDPVAATASPLEVLALAEELPALTVLFMFNVHLQIWAPGREPRATVVQAIWNLRDAFKADGRTLVLNGPTMDLPDVLAQDVMVFDEAYPAPDQLRTIVLDAYKNAKLAEPKDGGTVDRAVEALTGLPLFPAEQVTYMSLTKEGISLPTMRARKIRTINQTAGLRVWEGTSTFDDIRGYENAKERMRKTIRNKLRPGAIVWIDEIEKMLAGMRGDNTGVSQDQLGTTLSEMENNRWVGWILVGMPGTAKSSLARTVGGEADVLTVQLDYGAMKGGIVGTSEQNVRGAFKVIKSIAGDRPPIFVATSNGLEIIPAELKRRFKLGIFYCDLPTADERAAIWSLYFKKFGLKKQALPNDEGWTGAEIEMACYTAWANDESVVEAGENIVPVAKANPDKLAALRAAAAGKFINASKRGPYELPETAARSGRRVAVEA